MVVLVVAGNVTTRLHGKSYSRLMTADAFRILHSHCSLQPAKILNPADDAASCLSFVDRFSSCFRVNAGKDLVPAFIRAPL